MPPTSLNVRLADGSAAQIQVENGFIQAVNLIPAAADLPYILPGFIDSHCHVLPSGLHLTRLDLSPCASPDDVLQAVREAAPHVGPGQWLQAVMYDQTKFPGTIHLTRHDLDRVAPDVPVLLRHSNGHASVANSKALERAGITRETPDPEGGEFRRDANGEPDGVLLEKAHEAVTAAAPIPDHEEMVQAILAAGRDMARLGITCATDMMTGRYGLDAELAAYTEAARRGNPVRVRLYVQWFQVLGRNAPPVADFRDKVAQLDDSMVGFRGLKVFADGAIGSATAAVYIAYPTTGGLGQLIYPEADLENILKSIDDNGFRIAVHSIGDRSTDLVLEAYARTANPTQHRLEHAMILSDKQIDHLANINCKVTFQPEFLMRFGHAYRAQVPDRAPQLKRVRTVLERGIPAAFNSDRPIVPGNPWHGIQAAVARPEGFDPAENIDLPTAIRLYTQAGAEINFDADQGEVRQGMRADFQLYAEAPTPQSHPIAVYRGGELTFSA